MYSSTFKPEYDIIILPERKLWIWFLSSSDPGGPTTGTKFIIPCEFSPLQVKLHHVSNMKMEEYMEFELSGIFRVKLVAKNVVLGSPVTQ